MRTRLTRRRLLGTSLLGVPLAAACAGDDKPALETSGEVSAAPSAASPVSVASDAGAPQATASTAEVATPAPPGQNQKTIVLDPGHGGEEIGAASAIPGQPTLLEKDSNLAFGTRLRELLETDGFRVVMTRETDSRGFGYVAPPTPTSATPGPGRLTPGRADLQARIDHANASGGDLFLSLHSNDNGSLAESGVEVWYCIDREDGVANETWAQIVLENVLDAVRGYGYRANNRGIKEDRYFRVRNGRNFHLFVLGPPNPEARHPRSTMMPAALVENLFMRHERDQWVLRDPAAREAISQGMRQAVHRFFEWQRG